jgi:hypothetical protein
MAIKLGSGGGGSEINDIKPINTTELLHTDAEGNKWLRQGYLDTDTTTYPAPATVRKTIGEWDGVLNYSSGVKPEGICFDGTYYWIVELTGDTLQKLNASTFAVIGTFYITNYVSNPKSVCYDSVANELYVIGTTNLNRIARFNMSGTYVGNRFDARFYSNTGTTLSSSTATGITTDGTYIYTSHSSIPMAKHSLAKWNMAGVLQERIELPLVATTIMDVQLFDGNIWLFGNTPNALFSIDATTHIWNGDSMGTRRYDYTSSAFVFQGTTCVICTATSQPYYLKHPYVTGVGLGRMELPVSSTSTSGGLQVNYTRIK